MGKKEKEKQEEQISLWSRIKNASKKAKTIVVAVVGCVLIAGIIINANRNTYKINDVKFSIDKNSDVLYQTQLVEQVSEIIKNKTGYEAQKGDIAENLIVNDVDNNGYDDGDTVYVKLQDGLLDTIEVNGVIVEENTPEKVEEQKEQIQLKGKEADISSEEFIAEVSEEIKGVEKTIREHEEKAEKFIEDSKKTEKTVENILENTTITEEKENINNYNEEERVLYINSTEKENKESKEQPVFLFAAVNNVEENNESNNIIEENNVEVTNSETVVEQEKTIAR